MKRTQQAYHEFHEILPWNIFPFFLFYFNSVQKDFMFYAAQCLINFLFKDTLYDYCKVLFVWNCLVESALLFVGWVFLLIYFIEFNNHKEIFVESSECWNETINNISTATRIFQSNKFKILFPLISFIFFIKKILFFIK